MLFGIDLRLLAIIVSVAFFVYKNWRAGIAREARQDMMFIEIEKKITSAVTSDAEMKKIIEDSGKKQREICQKRADFMEQTYLRKDQFYAHIKPLEDNLRSLVEAGLPVELAKIQVSQAQILTSLKRLEDKIFNK